MQGGLGLATCWTEEAGFRLEGPIFRDLGRL